MWCARSWQDQVWQSSSKCELQSLPLFFSFLLVFKPADNLIILYFCSIDTTATAAAAHLPNDLHTLRTLCNMFLTLGESTSRFGAYNSSDLGVIIFSMCSLKRTRSKSQEGSSSKAPSTGILLTGILILLTKHRKSCWVAIIIFCCNRAQYLLVSNLCCRDELNL